MSVQRLKSRAGFDSSKERIINVADAVQDLDAVNLRLLIAKLAELTAGRIVPYDPGAGYVKGALVIYEGKLYITNEFIQKPAGPFNNTIWEYVGYKINDTNITGAADELYSSLKLNNIIAALAALNINYNNNTNIPNNPANVQLALEELHRAITYLQNGTQYLGVLATFTTVPVDPGTGDYYFAGYDGTHVGIDGGTLPFVQGNTIIYNGTTWEVISQNVGVTEIDGKSGSVSGQYIFVDGLAAGLVEQHVNTDLVIDGGYTVKVPDPNTNLDAANRQWVLAQMAAGGVINGPASVLEAFVYDSLNPEDRDIPLNADKDAHDQMTTIYYQNVDNGEAVIRLYVERDNSGTFAPEGVSYKKQTDLLASPIPFSDLVPHDDKPGFYYDAIFTGGDRLVDGDIIQVTNGDYSFTVAISEVAQISITSVNFIDGDASGSTYPAGQTAVKNGDFVWISVTGDKPFTTVTVAAIGNEVIPVVSDGAHTAIVMVAVDTSVDGSTFGTVSISDSNGTSPIVNTASALIVDNTVPSVNIASITYPISQFALKHTEEAFVVVTFTNSAEVLATNLLGQLTVPAVPIISSVAFSVFKTLGSVYNVSNNNLRITATGANGNTVVLEEVVWIADGLLVPSLTNGDILQSSTLANIQEPIEITFNQLISVAPVITLTDPGAVTHAISPSVSAVPGSVMVYGIAVDHTWGKGAGTIQHSTLGKTLSGEDISISFNTVFSGFHQIQFVIIGPNNGGTYAPYDLGVKVQNTNNLIATRNRLSTPPTGEANYLYNPAVKSSTEIGIAGYIEYGIIEGTLSDSLVIDYDSVVFFGGDNVEIKITEG